MDLKLYTLPDGHKALEFEFASPEEKQEYAGALLSQVPEGHILQVREGRSRNKRPTLTLAPVRIGETFALPDEAGSTLKPSKPAEPPSALQIPEVVKNATDEQLETMAARNHVPEVGGDAWRKARRPQREAAVARALKKVNQTETGVGRGG